MIKKVIYLPVQIKKRAFVAKLLLGYLSLKDHYCFIIGKRHSVKKIALHGPAGVFLEKDFFGKKGEYFNKFKNRDMKFYGLDDEGLVFHDNNEYLNRRVDYNNLKYLERVFAWGTRQANILNNFLGPNEGKKVVIVGNPRIDLLSGIGVHIYHKQIDCINKNYGNFILFNSFFALANGIKSIDELVDRLKRLKNNISDDIINYWYGFYEYQKQLFELIKDALKILAEKKQINIVIRPHPNEKIATWNKIFKNYKNVIVNKEFDIFPWIYTAKAIIHNSCTTGVEAYLLGKKVIAYQPVVNERFDLDLPNSLSIKITHIGGLKDIIEKIINNDYEENKDDLIEKERIMRHHIHLDKQLSSELILKEFNKNNYSKDIPTFKRDYFDLASGIVLNAIDRIYKVLKKDSRINNDFPYTKKNEIKDYLNLLNNYFGYNIKFKIKQLASSCFLVSPK
jgi:surface carbohydrate biosynthesis protein